jgi:hypothetical protein
MATYTPYPSMNSGTLSSNSTGAYNTAIGASSFVSTSASNSITISGNSSFTTISADDIKINQLSLRESIIDMQKSIDKIEKRVRILHINPELESRWDELKELGEKYREMEKEFLHLEKVYEALKS